MTRSARERVNFHLADSQVDSDLRLNTTNPTDDSARVGLYDYPPEDPRSQEHVSGRHRSRSTDRNVQYRTNRAREEKRRRKSSDTRARNASLRHSQVGNAANRSFQTKGSLGRAEANRPDAEAAPDASQRGRSEQRGRSLTIRIRRPSSAPAPQTVDPSPTPVCQLPGNKGSQPSQAPGESQYTYKYETLTHQGLVDYAKEEYGLQVQDCDTQTIINHIRHAATEQAHEVGPPQRTPLIVMLLPTPLGVGGGWSQNVVRPSKKRSSAPSDSSGGSSKRQRREIEVHNTATESKTETDTNTNTQAETNTATEPETEGEVDPSPRMVAERLLAALPNRTTDADPSTRPLQRGTCAPAPTRDLTPATVLDNQASNASSHSLGGSLPPCSHLSGEPNPQSSTSFGSIPKPPNLIKPVTGPAHVRLRSVLLKRWRDGLKANIAGREGSQERGSQSTDPDKVPETNIGSAINASQRTTRGSESDSASIAPNQVTHESSSARFTYSGYCSHLPSQPEPPATNTEAINHDNDDNEPDRPNSPTLTPAQLIRQERARAAAAKAGIQLEEMLPRSRAHLANPASATPTSRPQLRPALGGGNNAFGQRMGGPRRLDPASAARADMAAFSRAVAQGDIRKNGFPP